MIQLNKIDDLEIVKEAISIMSKVLKNEYNWDNIRTNHVNEVIFTVPSNGSIGSLSNLLELCKNYPSGFKFSVEFDLNSSYVEILFAQILSNKSSIKLMIKMNEFKKFSFTL